MIPYIGGKSFLSGWIISNFPSDFERRTYIEVFGGGGWVLFKKNPSNLEVYNDLNSNLVNLFKIIRDDYLAFKYKAEWTLHSRELYLEARQRLKEDKFLNELEQAITYAVEKIQSFSGNGGFAYQITADKIASGKWLPFLKRLEVINARLKKVQIECLDFEQLIKKYDNKKSLFYLDPPYVDAEHYYDNKDVHFRRAEHERLAKLLRKVKGKWIMSYYDHPLVRELYSGYRIISRDSVKHSQGITRSTKTKTKQKSIELLVMNY